MRVTAAIAAFVVVTTTATSAAAIPAFARKFNLPCSTCHLAPPYLNAHGRHFLEAGYRMHDEDDKIDEAMQNHQVINDNLVLEKMLPWTARVRSVPFDDSSVDGAHILPLASFEFATMGNFYKTGSFHLAVGGEFSGDFAFGGDGFIGIHPSPYFNVIGGFGTPFAPDPYNTFRTDDHGLTLKTKEALTEGHKSSMALVDDTSFVDGYGRVGMLFYMAGFAVTPGQLRATSPGVGLARVAIDPLENVSLGVFGVGGRRSQADPGVDGPAAPSTLWRAGADANATFADVTTTVAAVAAGDKLDGGVDQTSLGGFVETLYALRLEGRPVFMPLIRLDWVQRDGVDVLGGVLDLESYVFENVRVGAEVSYEQALATTDAPVKRGSVFLDLAF